MNEDASNNIYSKWLNNELTQVESELLKDSGDLDILQDIITEVDSWKTPEINFNYEDLKVKIETRKSKGKVISLYQKLAIAASLILIVSLGIGVLTSESETMYATNSGEIKHIIFPDGTKAVLNGSSTLSFIESDWKEERIVKLNGQAFFDISVKGQFDVEINNGVVKVLGTKFDVLTSVDYNNVKCFEGKVSVKTLKIDEIITEREGVDSDNILFKVYEIESNWTKSYTKFSNAKLIEVIGALSLKHGFQFDYKNIKISDKVFTGQFSNLDPKLALKMVFKPLGIDYSTEGKKVVLK
jgi:ferric-dicitrate binding protein FerR (iron transport regulator)